MSQEPPGNGNDHQDPDMAAMLSRIRAPQHRDDFWSSLHRELQVAARATPMPEETAAQEGGGDTVVPVHPTTGNGRGHGPGRDWRRWTLLVAAAVVVVTLIGGGYLALRDGDETSVINPPDPGPTLPEPSPTITFPEDDPADTTVPGQDAGVPFEPTGDPIERGSGWALAVDPSSSFVYLADAAPEGGQGCEGASRLALYVEPIGGGERVPIIGADTIDVTTGANIRFDSDGNVAVSTQCEGSGATVYTSTVQSDGTFGEITELTIPDLDLGQDVSGIIDLEFRDSGTLVAATFTVADDGTEHRHLYEFPVAPSEVTDLGHDGAIAVDVNDSGRLLILDTQGRVSFGGSPGYTTQSMTDIAITPSAARVVQTGSQATEVNSSEGNKGQGISVSGLAIPYIDETTAVIERLNDDGTSTAVAIDLRDLGGSDAQVELTAGTAGLNFAVAPDTSRVFATQLSADGSSYSFIEQRLAPR